MIFIEESLSRVALKGPHYHECDGLTRHRGINPSAKKIAKIELALAGLALISPIEFIMRIALIALAFIPCIGSDKGRALLGKIGLSILYTGATFLGALKGLVTNVAFAFLPPRKSSHGNYLKV